MGSPLAARIKDVLLALADLSPSGEPKAGGLTIPLEWFRWLPASAVTLFDPARSHPEPGSVFANRGGSQGWPAATIERAFGERLAAVDEVRMGSRSLRAGWLFVAGETVTADGRKHKVFHPLITVPVRVSVPPVLGPAVLVAAGDTELTPLVTDQKTRHMLEAEMEFGGGALVESGVTIDAKLLDRLHRLENFAREAAKKAGLPAPWLVPVSDGPDRLMQRHDLTLIAGVAVFAVHEIGGSSRASSLRGWAIGSLEGRTAFHSLYLQLEDEAPSAHPKYTVESPYLLTPTQRAAVAASRIDPITIISGAPGNGKSHTIVAMACDALANGERVLIAAKTDATVDALVDLLDRAPGPDPVIFGSNERRTALANRLSAGQLVATPDDVIERAEQQFTVHAQRRDEVRDRIASELARELRADGGDSADAATRALVPGLLDPDVDLDEADALLRVATTPATGWSGRRRAHRALDRLVEITGANPLPPPNEMRAHLRTARAARDGSGLMASGGLDLGDLWEQLLDADDRARASRGEWLEAEGRSRRRLSSSTLGAVAAAATALRSGRAARRAQLGILDDTRLTRALPLWVGTLADIDDLLPAVPALFDLVILDEASAIDQPLAATALLRGRRAVIAGDPHQLRHVSFVSDNDLETALQKNELDDSPVLSARLDVRRNSIFDVAAGCATVHVLEEHFRSAPHLVQFVADRFYDHGLQIATRSPRTHSKVCVDVVRLSGVRSESGVVEGEVRWVMGRLRELASSGAVSVGVVTPFRAQADAIETAVVNEFSATQLKAMGLRIGTVHAFQGNERDVILASMGVGSTDPPGTWRFVEDPHLLAVLLTRARRQMTLAVSADPPPDGLMAGYLAQADEAPGPPAPARPLAPWPSSIADDLAAGGLSVLRSYPTGRHVVDVTVDDPRECIGIECSVHPDGPEAHIDRHLALTRAGWTLLDAYRSRWAERRGELVVELLDHIDGASRSEPERQR